MTEKKGAFRAFFGKFRVKEGFTVTAHSGSMGLPANSVEAMEAGVAAGADIVEFDLQFMPDGAPVLSHDAPTGACVPLEEAFDFLRRHPDVQANVDVKTTAFLERVPPLAAAYGVTEQIFFTGIGEAFVPAAREKCPGIPYYLNTVIPPFTDLHALADKVRSLGAVGVNVSAAFLSRRLTRVFHKEGLLVSVWTVNKKTQARAVLSMRPDNVTTKKPDMILSLIRKD